MTDCIRGWLARRLSEEDLAWLDETCAALTGGRGLFLGVEFVRDRQSLEPAADVASYAVERMKERGVLLSTDGPDQNVIKIKPPMPFSADDADRLVRELDEVLAHDFVKASTDP